MTMRVRKGEEKGEEKVQVKSSQVKEQTVGGCRWASEG